VNSLKKKFHLAGIKEILLPRSMAGESLVTSGSRALFGPPPERAVRKKGRDLVDFLKQVNLFKDLPQGDLKRLARVVHERVYGNGEYIYEQGNPGVALYIVREGIVEITRRKRDGEEVSLARIGPPDSFEELAAVGAEVIRWTSARARGQVSLVAIGYSDLDALSHSFPGPANKILKKLAQAMAMRIQTLLDAGYFDEEGSVNSDV
jgi:CRP/FNR family transcriptional regulator, cyclic AMP receptor protein